MQIVGIQEARAHLSRLLTAVARGEKIVITKNGKPIANLQPHALPKNKVKFGTMSGKLHYKDENFVGTDPDIQKMFRR